MLTDEQIQFLYKFCEKKSVRYYDLQIELVDHLAAAIDEKMNIQPAISFDDALNDTYKGFGIFGFAHIVRDKETAMRKLYNCKKWLLFKTYFTYPKIAFTILAFLLLNLPLYFFHIADIDLYYMGLCAVAALSGIGVFLFLLLKFKPPRKRLLMLTPLSAFTVSGVLIQFPNFYLYGIKNFDLDITNFWLNMAISGFCLFLILLAVVMCRIYISLYQTAKVQYPLAFE